MNKCELMFIHRGILGRCERQSEIRKVLRLRLIASLASPPREQIASVSNTLFLDSQKRRLRRSNQIDSNSFAAKIPAEKSLQTEHWSHWHQVKEICWLECGNNPSFHFWISKQSPFWGLWTERISCPTIRTFPIFVATANEFEAYS